MTSDTTDAKVPALCDLQARNESSWTDAFRILWPCACLAASRAPVTLTLEEREDVAIDALVCLVERVESVRSFDELKALLVTISRRRTIDLGRKASAGKRFPAGGSLDSLDDPDSGIEIKDDLSSSLSELECKELTLLLHEALACLGEPTRTMLVQNVCQGMTLSELSRQYGLSLGGTAVKVNRGMNRVRGFVRGSPRLMKALLDFLQDR